MKKDQLKFRAILTLFLIITVLLLVIIIHQAKSGKLRRYPLQYYIPKSKSPDQGGDAIE